MNTNNDDDNDGVQVAVAKKRKANGHDNEQLVWTVKVCLHFFFLTSLYYLYFRNKWVD